MKCRCTKPSKWYSINESEISDPNQYEFIVGQIYEVEIERDAFWGDSYVVKNPPHKVLFGVKNHENTPEGRAFSDFFELIS